MVVRFSEMACSMKHVADWAQLLHQSSNRCPHHCGYTLRLEHTKAAVVVSVGY